MRVLLAGGGTGGHILPLISIKEEIERIATNRREETQFLFIGHLDENGKALLEKHNIAFRSVYAGKMRRYASFENFSDPFKTFLGLLQSLWYVWKFMPDVTIGKGGYASVPGVLASAFYQVPILIHESDSVAGRANKFLSNFATIIAVAFPEAEKEFPKKKTSLVGNITHLDIANGDGEKAKLLFKLTFERPIVLVTGGSQGSQVINKVIWNTLPELLTGLEIIHIVGEANMEEAKTIHNGLDTRGQRFYHYYGFLNDELKHAYQVADIVISRAGASTLTDISLNKKPSILVPISIDGGQQKSNAYIYAKAGAAEVIEEQNFTHHVFLTKLMELFENRDLMTKMGQKAYDLAIPDAAKRIAEEVEVIVRNKSL
jgi:UDP-N-acetylglucosamine--N-acetylmuramyl-(pentapeptide) pyrophosphoryl-undecaprenol N-acetylglucosamine transferase